MTTYITELPNGKYAMVTETSVLIVPSADVRKWTGPLPHRELRSVSDRDFVRIFESSISAKPKKPKGPKT